MFSFLAIIVQNRHVVESILNTSTIRVTKNQLNTSKWIKFMISVSLI